MQELPMFRPPSEADSLILRVADGCPHNGCTFCGMYKSVRYRAHTSEEIDRAIDQAAMSDPAAARVFLADGDVMAFSYERLGRILDRLAARLPRLARVSLYANGRSILSKSDAQLRRLRAARLHTLYMGLESGDQETLSRVGKCDRASEMIFAAQRAQAAGLRMSVMVLTGLAGRQRSRVHAVATAEAVNGMQPAFLAALRYIPVPGTPLMHAIAGGSFQQLTELEAVQELRELVSHLDLHRTLFRANHVSNVVPLAGRFPRDQERLVAELDALRDSGRLDASGPGLEPLWL